MEEFINEFNNNNTKVTLENCHSHILYFIKNNNIQINNYEEDMKETYLKMLKNNYIFLVNKELLSEIMIDIVYRLSPKDELNIEMVKNTFATWECDSSSEEEDDEDNITWSTNNKRMNRMQQQNKLKNN